MYIYIYKKVLWCYSERREIKAGKKNSKEYYCRKDLQMIRKSIGFIYYRFEWRLVNTFLQFGNKCRETSLINVWRVLKKRDWGGNYVDPRQSCLLCVPDNFNWMFKARELTRRNVTRRIFRRGFQVWAAYDSTPRIGSHPLKGLQGQSTPSAVRSLMD